MYKWLVYFDYIVGVVYVVFRDVVVKIYEVSQILNFSMYIDDVFMGFCVNKVGILLQDYVFFFGEGKIFYYFCIYEKMMIFYGYL